MPRLLILCEYPTLLGGERSMLATLPAVTAAGFDVMVAGPAAGPLAAALHDRGISHVAWQTRDASSDRLSLSNLRTDLGVIIQHTRPDLLCANSLSTSRIAGPVAAASPARSVGYLRDIIKLSNQSIEDINQHDGLVAVSHATRDSHVGQGLDATKCVVLYNGVDLDEFQPRAPTGYLHRQLNLPSTAPLIAVIGQLGLRKGTDVALTAALQVAKSVPDAHWLVVGTRTSNKTESRDFEARLHSIAASPDLVGRVHFLGNRNDTPELFNECTLLVHSARQEPLGRVLLESAASGLAIIATSVGGTPEIFPPETDSAHLVPADDPDALAAAIIFLLQDKSRRRSLASAAHRRAESAFNIEFTAAHLIEYYWQILA